MGAVLLKISAFQPKNLVYCVLSQNKCFHFLFSTISAVFFM
ncbi:hypothetical protein BPO_1099 [Bergeyella porcorum]|uniref:Uncharacterized protein n=1 Tax=Bergeyella porcorum TaxID=1735111 RepID=A0AAU0F6X6_9FLAO